MKKVGKVQKATKAQVSKKTGPSRELVNLVDSLNKKFGENAISIGVPNEEAYVDERIPTGSLTLDIALGGGIPVGRYTQIAGLESSSKTTQTLHIIRNAQKMGMTVAFLDVEGTSDEGYFEMLGVDYSNLLYSRPDGSEEAYDMMLALQKSGYVDLGIIDSIAALAPNREQNKESLEDKMQMGITQQLLGEFFRKYQANNNRRNREGKKAFTLICINQLREKIGAYGDPYYAPGGNAKNFAMSVDLRLSKGDWIVEGKGEDKAIVGQVVKFKITKNKTYKRMQTGEFDLYLDANNAAGVDELYNDNFKEIVMLSVELGIVERKGAWFQYKDQRFQGMPNLIAALRDDEDMMDEIREQVLSMSIIKHE